MISSPSSIILDILSRHFVGNLSTFSLKFEFPDHVAQNIFFIFYASYQVIFTVYVSIRTYLIISILYASYPKSSALFTYLCVHILCNVSYLTYLICILPQIIFTVYVHIYAYISYVTYLILRILYVSYSRSSALFTVSAYYLDDYLGCDRYLFPMCV